MNTPHSSKKILTKNPLELLREGTREVTEIGRRELVDPMAREFLDQLLSRKRKTFSGELSRGDTLDMKEVTIGVRAQKEKHAQQIAFERQLLEEERILVERKGAELSLQINAIHAEVMKVAQLTPNLSREIQIASFQAPVHPDVYDKFFLTRILEFILSFRKNIESAHEWLSTANGRASKKNVWGQNYKKHGAKYLLSGEHYSGRSAA